MEKFIGSDSDAPPPPIKARAMKRAAAEVRLSQQFDVRRHRLRQMEEKAARRAAERAAGRQGSGGGGPNEDEEERALFLEMAAFAIAQAEAEGTPTYPLRRAVHAALHPVPLSAAKIKPKSHTKAVESGRGAGNSKTGAGGSLPSKAKATAKATKAAPSAG